MNENQAEKMEALIKGITEQYSLPHVSHPVDVAKFLPFLDGLEGWTHRSDLLHGMDELAPPDGSVYEETWIGTAWRITRVSSYYRVYDAGPDDLAVFIERPRPTIAKAEAAFVADAKAANPDLREMSQSLKQEVLKIVAAADSTAQLMDEGKVVVFTSADGRDVYLDVIDGEWKPEYIGGWTETGHFARIHGSTEYERWVDGVPNYDGGMLGLGLDVHGLLQISYSDEVKGILHCVLRISGF